MCYRSPARYMFDALHARKVIKGTTSVNNTFSSNRVRKQADLGQNALFSWLTGKTMAY
jgi:hypothetical protein